MEETDKYFSAADAGTRPKPGLGCNKHFTLSGSGELRGVAVNKDSPIFTMKQEMDLLNFPLQLFISAL